MQGDAGIGAEPNDIAGVRGNFRFKENNGEHPRWDSHYLSFGTHLLQLHENGSPSPLFGGRHQ
jgi:hypothetical protein